MFCKRCADCGVELARACTFEVCPRCLFKRGPIVGARTREISRAVHEFRASCTYVARDVEVEG